MAFSTAEEIKVNKEIDRLTSQSAWQDAEFDERIREGDAMIEGCLADMGYDLPAILVLAPVPKLINELSKLYARAAILRDLFTRGPVATSEDRHKEMFESYEEMIEKLKNRELQIVDGAGNTITFIDTNEDILVNTLNVKRALTMGVPEFQEIDSEAYSSREVTGDPDC